MTSICFDLYVYKKNLFCHLRFPRVRFCFVFCLFSFIRAWVEKRSFVNIPLFPYRFVVIFLSLVFSSLAIFFEFLTNINCLILRYKWLSKMTTHSKLTSVICRLFSSIWLVKAIWAFDRRPFILYAVMYKSSRLATLKTQLIGSL